MMKRRKLKLLTQGAQLDYWDEHTPSEGKSKRGHCHEHHKAFSLGGGTVLGASCNHPREGFDVYVGLDWGMRRMSPSYPWEPDATVTEVYFPVTDGQAPKDAEQFKKMIQWLVEQLALGKRVHVGCIGGHGRTGTLLAALVSVINKDADAANWVRKHYCSSAVETKSQTEFLAEHFGVLPVSGSKAKYETYSSDPKTSSYSPLRGRSVWDDEWAQVSNT
jgi:hypothetical protein